MGQCTSKYEERKGASSFNPTHIRRSLNDEHQTSNTSNQNWNQTSVCTSPVKNPSLLLDNQVCLSSTEDDNYSSDFCEEEESYATANSSSRSMKNPISRKTSSGTSRKSSSVNLSLFSPNKVSPKPSIFLSPNSNKHENGGSNLSIHDVVKKPGCEMYVIGFENDVPVTSPRKKIPLRVYNTKDPLHSSAHLNSTNKKTKKATRFDRIAPRKNPSSTLSPVISKEPHMNKKRSKLRESMKGASANYNQTSIFSSNAHQREFKEANHQRSNSPPKECSNSKHKLLNKKLRKDVTNQTTKSQDSPGHNFVRKKWKNENNSSTQSSVGKHKRIVNKKSIRTSKISKFY